MSEPLKTEIIAIGTELLLGQITNTNASWMSAQLADNGINTYHHVVVGDNDKRIVDVFEKAQMRSDIIIVTGGLGPTEDDLSREAFQKMSGLNIVAEPKALYRIEAFFQSRGEKMTENNRRQARVFEGSTVLDNKHGMAPGNLVTYQDKIWIFLPGVPREMKQLFRDEVLPFLVSKNGQMVIQSKVLKFIGIGEAALENELTDLFHFQTNPTLAPLAQKDGVVIRLTAKAASKAEAHQLLSDKKKAVLDVIGQHFYGEDDETIEACILSLLKKQKLTLSAAESLTGGWFSSKFISVENASQAFKGSVVCYDAKIKTDILNVSNTVIENEGTVSEACAKALARNVSQLMKSDLGISFTGVAGPNEAEGKEVGTVYITLYDRSGYQDTKMYHFRGNRNQIRYRAVLKGYELIFNYLNEKTLK